MKTKIWIKKAIKVHGDLYDYSKTIYERATGKVIIICKIHGEFLQTAANHLTGSGCPSCGKIKNSENRTLSNFDFIKKAIEVHGNLFDYSKTVYKSMSEDVLIICRTHGEFYQQAGNHLMGSGCLSCARESRRSNTEEFVKKSNEEVHYHQYDYSKTVYKTAEEPVIITCRKHGDFSQKPSVHLNGSGCPSCSKLTFQDFLNKINKVFGDLYDYSKTVYINTTIPINIGCKIHGEFTQRVYNHLNGYGCPKCRKNTEIEITKDQFLINANITHNNKYDYSNINYINSHTDIEIFCNELNGDEVHGYFLQRPNNHIQGKGCPKCAIKYDKTESELVDFIKSLDIKNIKLNDRKILSGKELDIYLPDYNLAIEFNGLYWHSDVHKEDKYHLLKTEECLKQGIQLIHIFEDEWLSKKEIVKSRLLSLINKIPKNKTIYARKCYVKEITDKSTVKDFLERNHIQGSVGNKVSLGLYLPVEVNGIKKEYLVSIMTFGSFRKNLGNNNTSENDYELLRFCNVINYSVVGGASKLLKYFEVYFKPENIISYADRRWSKGNLYDKLNFQLSHVSPANYFYIDGLKRYNRFNYRKDILISKYGCLPEDTERNFTKNVLLLNRIYDSGTLVYKKTYLNNHTTQ